jgi:hypothetical protein
MAASGRNEHQQNPKPTLKVGQSPSGRREAPATEKHKRQRERANILRTVREEQGFVVVILQRPNHRPQEEPRPDLCGAANECFSLKSFKMTRTA